MDLRVRLYYDLNNHNVLDINDKTQHLNDQTFQMSYLLPVPIDP